MNVLQGVNMKAAQIKAYGMPDTIEITETAIPVNRDDQVLVKVHAASLNPFDLAVISGHVSKTGVLSKPITIGGDFSGEITSVGKNITGFQIGDKVYGQSFAIGGSDGPLSEYVVVKADKIAIAPPNIDYNEAASLPLVGVSAIQALYEHAKL